MIDRRRFIRSGVLGTTLIALQRSGMAMTPGDQKAEMKSMQLFYRPADARVGDCMPYFWNGRFYLFYLPAAEGESSKNEGSPCALVSTEDFVNFTDHGVVIPHGGKNEHDFRIFTGSLIYANGMHHFFYTGYNAAFDEQRKPSQVIMHAVSTDLLQWTKIPEHSFSARTDLYELNDWRDPFVFWNEAAGEYWMLIAARLKAGTRPRRRRGCVALCASKDMQAWDVRGPFWAPGLYYTHECPDLFRMGDWWYLIFSEFTGAYRTRYRMARAPDGPWLTPHDDVFDARAFYAAKTVSDGKQRYLCGWIPDRVEKKDSKGWAWGGNLAVHQLKQGADGSLSSRLPDTINAVWNRSLPMQFTHILGEVKQGRDRISIDAPRTFACAAADRMPKRCKIEAQASFTPGTQGFGLMLRASDDLDSAYYIRLEPSTQRVRFDCWLQGFSQTNLTNIDVTPGAMVGLERAVALAPSRSVDLKLVVDGTIVVVYLDGGIAMSSRMYDMPLGRWGFFVEQGGAEFSAIKMMTLEF